MYINYILVLYEMNFVLLFFVVVVLLLLVLTLSYVMQSHSTANASAALSSSPGFVRPSRTATSASKYLLFLNMHVLLYNKCMGICMCNITVSCIFNYLGICCMFFFNFSSDTGFGSALNIETLVAAAERKETPLEVF